MAEVAQEGYTIPADTSLGVQKEGAEFQWLVTQHLNRISLASTNSEDYLNYIECFEDFLSPYFDERYENDLWQVQDKAKKIDVINKKTGRVDNNQVMRIDREVGRGKLRALMKLALRKNFIPSGELEGDML